MRKLVLTIVSLLFAAGSGVAQEMRTVVDDAGRSVEIPVNPTRIVSQNDNRLTLPLLELGAPVVGSAGRIGADGKPFLRTIPDLLGVDFSNSNIEFVGTFAELDFEKITALKPDLLITMRDDSLEPLSRIAPTLFINPNLHPVREGMKLLADVSNTMDAYDRLVGNYENKLTTVAAHFPAGHEIKATVTFSFPAGDALYVYRDLGALTVAMADLGISQPAQFAEMEPRRIALSAEELQSIDADFIINFYGSEASAGPENVRAGLENFVPGWCGLLNACREGQYIFFPYASFGYAFAALELNLDLLTTHMAGRTYTAK